MPPRTCFKQVPARIVRAWHVPSARPPTGAESGATQADVQSVASLQGFPASGAGKSQSSCCRSPNRAHVPPAASQSARFAGGAADAIGSTSAAKSAARAEFPNRGLMMGRALMAIRA